MSRKLKLYREVRCPECTMVIAKDHRRGGNVTQLSHPLLTRGCSRSGEVRSFPYTAYALRKEGGTPYLQVLPHACADCRQVYGWMVMSCRLRIRFFHGFAPLPNTCKSELIYPLAKFIIFV